MQHHGLASANSTRRRPAAHAFGEEGGLDPTGVALSSLRGAEATKQSSVPLRRFWIASRNLSSAAHSRDPLAGNDVAV
jgi:hypothetical protein